MHHQPAPRHAVDRLVITPATIDLARSPLRGHFEAETFVLGAFNPGLTRLANGNLLLMVRVAEALRDPVRGGQVHAIRADGRGAYSLEGWDLDGVDMSDPRTFSVADAHWTVLGLTSLSWLLPIELAPDGLDIVAIHYDLAIVPTASYQSYGIEDPRISKVGDQWVMTTCSVSPERLCTVLYTSPDALNWTCRGVVLDHQNKDMLVFEGQVAGQFWAQTRPIGDVWFAYPPGSPWRAGPAIQLASSPDLLHWKPCDEPGLRPHAATLATARMGGGAPPLLTEIAGRRGWLSLWHGVAPNHSVGTYRTYWTLLDEHEPWKVVATSHTPLIEPAPVLTAPLADDVYLGDITFTTGVVDAGDHFIVASGEADLVCRITHVAKSTFVPA